jgi:hypothetical protein
MPGARARLGSRGGGCRDPGHPPLSILETLPHPSPSKPVFPAKVTLPRSVQSEHVRTHQNTFRLVRKPRYISGPRFSIMTKTHEVAFSLSLQRKGIRTMSVRSDDRQESEVSGTLGTLESATVLDDILLEIHCTQGTLRISLPQEQLKQFRTSSPTNV